MASLAASSFRKFAPTRHMGRMTEIAGVAAALGWQRVADRLGRPRRAAEAAARHTPHAARDAERLRLALERLGGAFVKFGQLLSVRQDRLPPELIGELQKLQDAVPPFSAEDAATVIREELGADVRALFAQFEAQPLAAASIAQVHRATLPDGTPVIVKVQRPGIGQAMEKDVRVLFFIARLIEKRLPAYRRYEPVGLVEEFAETISRELDFRLERQAMERFRGQFEGDPALHVPRSFAQLSGTRVLTMEYSHGHKVRPGEPPDPAARHHLADELLRLYIAQVFEHGLVHGDPHPGNVFLLPDGRWCFHDFGIVGRLSRRERDGLRQLFVALITQDAAWWADAYLDMGGADEDIDRKAFERDLEVSFERFYALPPEHSSFAGVLHEFIRLGQRHHIRLVRDLVLTFRAFMTMETLIRTLEPGFDMIAAMRRHGPRIVAGGLAVPAAAEAAGLLVRARSLLSGVPEAVVEAVRDLRSDRAALRLRQENLARLEGRLDRASNRVSLSVIIASLLVASALLTAFDVGPHLKGVPLPGVIGYAVAGILALWWAAAILRSGRF